MRTVVLLDPGCCPVGSPVVRSVRAAGAGAVEVTGPAGTDQGWDGSPSPGAEPWRRRVADVLGLHREALLAGCPVPLAEALAAWGRVADALAAQGSDVVVVAVPAAGVGDLVEAPQRLLRVVDARLDALAVHVDSDHVADEVSDLLALRPELLHLVSLAAAAAGLGTTAQHRVHGCARPGGLALPALDRDDLLAGAPPTWVPRESLGVRRAGGDLLWWVQVPAGADPRLQQEAEWMLLDVGDQRRTLRLPAALTRCRVGAATVVADRLEVRFTPDPDSWR